MRAQLLRWVGVLGGLVLFACTEGRSTLDAPDAARRVPTAGSGTERPSKLVIGLTPYLSPAEMLEEFAPLAEHIGNVVGIPTELQVAANYAAMSQRMASGDLHLAAMSPFTYVRALRDNPGIILLATHIADGSSTYSAYIVTKEDSGIDRMDQLRGKRFGFIDRSSASGYLYPLAYLRSLGHEPGGLFSDVTFAGNHPNLIKLVLAGELDAGATFSTAFKNAKNNQLRILTKTGRIPYDAYCANPRLDRGLVRQIRQLLLALSTRDEAGRKILGRLAHINGFVEVGDDHYDDVRRVARLVENGEPTSP